MNEYELLKALRSSGYRTLVTGRAGATQYANGAVGHNVPNYLHAAEQRHAIWFVQRGILNTSTDDMLKAVNAMGYGFAHQTISGNFSNTLGKSAAEMSEADAFFVQGFARTYVDLRGAGYADRLDKYASELTRALSWLVQNKANLVALAGDAPNRLLFDAIALRVGGRLVGHSMAMSEGWDLVSRAMQTQNFNGYFVEKGGWDSSYNAVSCLNLGWLILDEPDAFAKNTMLAAYKKAVEWEATRIKPTGEVDATGNTRTGLGQETTLWGDDKGINYAEVALSFYQASVLLDAKYATTADRIVGFAS